MIVISWRSLALGCLAALMLAAVTFWAALPKLSCPGVPSTEFAAIATLRTYLSAQNQFHRTHGRTASLDELARFGLIDEAMAKATSSKNPRAGYYFCEILGAAGKGPYDFSIDCGLCAFPAEYNVTGRNTFIIDVTGVVYQKDTQGWPAWIYPADPGADGWRPAGSE